MVDPEPDLTAEDLACRRGDRLVFAELSFRLPAGGALMLTGSNGSGKTSLLRLVATLTTPCAGRLAWGAEAIAGDPAGHRARLHYVGHLDAIKPTLTLRETLLFWAALRGNAVTRSTLDRALAIFALDALGDWPCRWLSAGQRRRLALCRLLVVAAPIWLLDEPTSALDDESRRRLEQVIAAHRETGGRVILSTHAPVALDAAACLVLDDFAPPLDAAGIG